MPVAFVQTIFVKFARVAKKLVELAFVEVEFVEVKLVMTADKAFSRDAKKFVEVAFVTEAFVENKLVDVEFEDVELPEVIFVVLIAVEFKLLIVEEAAVVVAKVVVPVFVEAPLNTKEPVTVALVMVAFPIRILFAKVCPAKVVEAIWAEP